jgi:hypothetical protein
MIASSNRGALFLQTINSATGTGKAVPAGPKSLRQTTRSVSTSSDFGSINVFFV